jgi:hypothetical protein
LKIFLALNLREINSPNAYFKSSIFDAKEEAKYGTQNSGPFYWKEIERK